MLNWIKWLVFGVITLLILSVAGTWITLSLSLPELDGDRTTPAISNTVTLSRDSLGQAVITADSRADAAYALGLAHGQDRFFQMDLQRRVAAGELSEWLGNAAINADKRARFHLFRASAERIFTSLPDEQKQLLENYARGVNDAIADFTVAPFEYLLTGGSLKPWKPEDSILVVFSMYMDLQLGQVDLDFAREALTQTYGSAMLPFLNPPSTFQAALDGSIERAPKVPVPYLNATASVAFDSVEPRDIGSNNWAVTGALTDSGSAMLANDMHLGLRVPIIWYRAQLNYTRNDQPVQVTGVSLPGLPGIVVGTNGHIAWGFTNANLDNVDWVKLNADTPTLTVNSPIALPQGSEPFSVEMSEFGPVREWKGERYALRWVAHEKYAVNLNVANLDLANTTEEAIGIAHTMGIPVQNMMIVDASGNAAWTPGGAVTARPQPSNVAVSQNNASNAWSQQEDDLPVVLNPESQRLWTANARVISTKDLPRFGNGGYALGARGQQIRDRLYDYEQFDETRFYQIQLDNEARFLMPWQQRLLKVLRVNSGQFKQDIAYLQDWQSCACSDSVGYTLVRRFRSAVISDLLEPVFSPLERSGVKTGGLLRQVEPTIWRLLDEQPQSWLPSGSRDWNDFLVRAYTESRDKLLTQYDTGNGLADLTWGNVNALKVEHPFSKQIPLIGDWLNQPVVAGFGDSYMPAVQATDFGASERFFVRPGNLDKAILTLPGGQSGHPLSAYYHAGFDDYAENVKTPLLPGITEHTLTLSRQN